MLTEDRKSSSSLANVFNKFEARNKTAHSAGPRDAGTAKSSPGFFQSAASLLAYLKCTLLGATQGANFLFCCVRTLRECYCRV